MAKRPAKIPVTCRLEELPWPAYEASCNWYDAKTLREMYRIAFNRTSNPDLVVDVRKLLREIERCLSECPPAVKERRNLDGAARALKMLVALAEFEERVLHLCHDAVQAGISPDRLAAMTERLYRRAAAEAAESAEEGTT